MGLTALLAGHSGLTVLESAASLATLGDALEAVEADVLLLALEPGETLMLPFRTAPDNAGRLPAIVLLGDEPAAAWASRVLRGGASGALPRTATADQIVAAVLAAAAGLVVREPVSVGSSEIGSSISTRPLQPLTPREVEILDLLADGLGNKAIAARLGISDHTVKTHVASVFSKLGVSTRAEAVATAARLGLIML
jgi:DNA-binding NarL/FixJ family response regulator